MEERLAAFRQLVKAQRNADKRALKLVRREVALRLEQANTELAQQKAWNGQVNNKIAYASGAAATVGLLGGFLFHYIIK